MSCKQKGNHNPLIALYAVLYIIKYSEKCAHYDWSEQVRYNSIKHMPYVTQVFSWDLMHAAYVISMSACNSQYI